jgi:hypothetical protein
MKAPPVFDANPSQLRESIYKIGQGQIDDRLQYFAKVRGLFTSNMQSLLKEELSQTVFANFESALFEQIAYFEATAFEYLDSGAMQIDDQAFNLSLKILSALHGMTMVEANDSPNKLTEQATSISLISEYYRGMDYLLAEYFYRAHHRRERRIRIGPFSFFTGNQWVEVERPAIVLDSEEKRVFDDRVWQRLSGYSYADDPKLRSIIKLIESEPMVIIAGY